MEHGTPPTDGLPGSAAELVERVGTIVEAHRQGTLPRIVQLGHPALRHPTQEFEGQLDAFLLAGLLETMRATMHAAPGVGLAAPQLGIPLRIAVLEDRFEVSPEVAEARERAPLDYFAVLNPRYAARGERSATFYEGCLSFTGYQAVVERPAEIEATYVSPEGAGVVRQLSGWQARIFQHETDHLDGTVYIDKAATRSLCTTEEYLARWADPGIGRARDALGF